MDTIARLIVRVALQFLSVVQRDIKNFDNEADLKAAWKVFDRVSAMQRQVQRSFEGTRCLCPSSLMIVPLTSGWT